MVLMMMMERGAVSGERETGWGVLLLVRWQHPTMYGARCFGLYRKDKLNSFAGKDSISCDGRSRTFGSGDNPESRLHGCPYSFKQLAANGFMWIPRGGFPQMTVCASCGKRVRSWSKRQLPWCGPRGPPPSSSTFRAKPPKRRAHPVGVSRMSMCTYCWRGGMLLPRTTITQRMKSHLFTAASLTLFVSLRLMPPTPASSCSCSAFVFNCANSTIPNISGEGYTQSPPNETLTFSSALVRDVQAAA